MNHKNKEFCDKERQSRHVTNGWHLIKGYQEILRIMPHEKCQEQTF